MEFDDTSVICCYELVAELFESCCSGERNLQHTLPKEIDFKSIALDHSAIVPGLFLIGWWWTLYRNRYRFNSLYHVI
jgi:hypothetical protein